jgi:hypothetical protein
MRITYELNDVFKIEEMCDFMSRIRKDGLVAIDYIINRDTEEMYFCSVDSCERYKVIIDQHKLILDGFNAKEALEYYEVAIDCFEKEK